LTHQQIFGNIGQTKWDETQVLLGTAWEMHLGTLWELDGNITGTHWKQGKKNKKSLSPALFRKKKTGPFMIAC
jgi:hypothetical protein